MNKDIQMIISCDICYTIINGDSYKIVELLPEDDFIRVCNDCSAEDGL